MKTPIRILAIIGAIWSLVVSFSLLVLGAAFSLTDMFNGPHTGVMIGTVLLELWLLFALYRAYSQKSGAIALLILWIPAAALQTTKPFTVGGWLESIALTGLVMAPITLLIIIEAVRQLRSSGPQP